MNAHPAYHLTCIRVLPREAQKVGFRMSICREATRRWSGSDSSCDETISRLAPRPVWRSSADVRDAQIRHADAETDSPFSMPPLGTEPSAQ
jgi:hypothetical protein